MPEDRAWYDWQFWLLVKTEFPDWSRHPAWHPSEKGDTPNV